MAAVRGQLDPKALPENRRSAARRKLQLEAQGATPGTDTASVLIQDISRTGLLFETNGELSAGETIEIELPGASSVPAVVKWTSGRFFGCEFKTPISDAVVSASLLRAAPRPIPGVTAVQRPVVGNEAQGDADKLPRVVRTRLLLALVVVSWAIIATGALLAIL